MTTTSNPDVANLVATVQPLRVNLPLRGQRHVFTQVLQIEVNKKLFMDTKTFRPTEGLAKLKKNLDALLEAVAKDTRSCI